MSTVDLIELSRGGRYGRGGVHVAANPLELGGRKESKKGPRRDGIEPQNIVATRN